jgi:eukaryotic-like serine/threonine-protein kinase
MALSVAQMARMSRLLDEALTLDEPGRRRWLKELHPEHRDLEAALRRALRPASKDGAEAPATLPQVGFGAPAPAVATLKPGDRVGPYQLMRELGSGGMADVWLAQRADGGPERLAARSFLWTAQQRTLGASMRFRDCGPSNYREQ